MSSSGHHAADDGSLARSTGGAAARGAMLIALALVIGLVLMAFALDDQGSEITSGDSASDSDTTTDTSDTGDGTDADTGDGTDTDPGTSDTAVDVVDPGDTAAPETIPEVPEGDGPRPPAEVNILVANGTGGRGIAGSLADKLIADGYIAKAANAPSTAAGIIYYRQGYADDARAVATILGAPPDILTQAPGDGTIAVAPEAVADGRLTDANVIVIVGADNAVPPG
ncbi:MAG: LytR C-terminal domain-containing protein [Acidimicrobiia bacterium]|nr:LytR C-terminal domain-containing protein [Acidimicrobiia bacterium]